MRKQSKRHRRPSRPDAIWRPQAKRHPTEPGVVATAASAVWVAAARAGGFAWAISSGLWEGVGVIPSARLISVSVARPQATT